MEPQDALLNLIRQLVGQRIPPPHQEQVIQIVAITMAQLMSDPRFVSELSVVRDLRSLATHLRNENVLLKQAIARPSKAAPRKAAAPRKRAPTKAATQAFQAGVRDLRR